MSRYVFTYEVDGICKIYEESTHDEDRLDYIESDDPNGSPDIAIEFSGSGYLAFWARCKKLIRTEFPAGTKAHSMGVIYDLWYDDAKVISRS